MIRCYNESFLGKEEEVHIDTRENRDENDKRREEELVWLQRLPVDPFAACKGTDLDVMYRNESDPLL